LYGLFNDAKKLKKNYYIMAIKVGQISLSTTLLMGNVKKVVFAEL
jgi:hypothetical protein